MLTCFYIGTKLCCPKKWTTCHVVIWALHRSRTELAISRNHLDTES